MIVADAARRFLAMGLQRELEDVLYTIGTQPPQILAACSPPRRSCAPPERPNGRVRCCWAWRATWAGHRCPVYSPQRDSRSWVTKGPRATRRGRSASDDDVQSDLRIRAATALGRLGALDEAIESLPGVIANPRSGWDCLAAVFALHTLDTAAAQAAVVAALEDPRVEPWLRVGCCSPRHGRTRRRALHGWR